MNEAVIRIRLVPESKDVTPKQIAEEIKETLKCAWLRDVDCITIYTDDRRLPFKWEHS